MGFPILHIVAFDVHFKSFILCFHLNCIFPFAVRYEMNASESVVHLGA
jgi:hypothetical protein